MSRTLTEVYNQIEAKKNQYLRLTEANNDSKMSVINCIMYVVATAIVSLEQLMDAFMVDLAGTFNGRINGTSQYYANAMLKWQYGDELEVNEDGTAFSYPNIDTTKQIIKHVSYQETYSTHYKDDVLMLKVAAEKDDHLIRLTDDQLISARAYLNQIKFAGVKCQVISRQGDVLVPKLTVYHDGALPQDELYEKITESLTKFISQMKFDSVLYVQRVIDAIQAVEHVTDVHMDPEASSEQGIFIAAYDDDGNIGELTKVERKCYASSGYIKESTRKDVEKELPTFKEAIILKLEDK